MRRGLRRRAHGAVSPPPGGLLKPRLPAEENHYAQSGIFTPADIPFSRDAVAAECTPNIETVVMQDLDIELLWRHRYKGTTLNWQDRRKDVYQLHYVEDGEDRVV